MTDQDQAARIAAMRARRGQAPIAIPTTGQSAAPVARVARVAPVAPVAPAASTSWAAPAGNPFTRPQAGVGTPTPAPAPAPVYAPVPIPPAVEHTQPVATRSASQRPAPTKRTGAAPAARPGRKPHPHIAAGARIMVTGLAASAVFGLTTVIAAANRPASITAAPTPTTPVDPTATAPVDPTASTVAPTTLVPGDTVVLTIPAIGASTVPVVLPVPGAVAPVAPVAPGAPAAPAPNTPVVTAPRAATPAPVVTQPAAPVVTQPPAPVVTQPPAPVVTQPPAPVTTQPAPPPPATTKPSG
ncbi:MAG: hypothetical protein Q7V88_16460 [Actinomycetota bacterium]|nr:hypothetical protein [Actinomycetota bacterium]